MGQCSGMTPDDTRVKAPRVPVDAPLVIVVFALFGALLASCGVGFVALGIAMLIEGNSAGIVGVICGLPICYGGYLFGRAAIRVRRDLHEHPLNIQQRRSRQRKLHFFLGYTASLIVGAVTLPVPTILRVIMAVCAVLVLPVMLAREFEPAKRHEPPSG